MSQIRQLPDRNYAHKNIQRSLHLGMPFKRSTIYGDSVESYNPLMTPSFNEFANDIEQHVLEKHDSPEHVCCKISTKTTRKAKHGRCRKGLPNQALAHKLCHASGKGRRVSYLIALNNNSLIVE